MSSITITVPLDYFALTRASDMLHGMALDLENQGKRQARRGDDRTVWNFGHHPTRTEAQSAFVPAAEPGYRAGTSTGVDDQYAPDPNGSEAEKDAAAVFGGAPGKSPSPSMFAETATEPASARPAGTTPPPVATAGAPEPASGATERGAPSTDPNVPAEPAPAAASSGPAPAGTPAAPAGVELDSDGLPWDSRIHSGSKGKLAKTKQWKKKRGVDPALVEQVEAELKAAMSASPANPVEPSAEAHTPTPAPAPAPPAEKPAAPSGAITTFPALMQKITAQGVPQADVTAAVNKQGLQALPLLAARPDLIPAVAATLFGS